MTRTASPSADRRWLAISALATGGMAASLCALAMVVAGQAEASKALRLGAFPAQLVCVDDAGVIVHEGAFSECYRAHLVPADR